jgi:transcriptional regulator with PAS, ATPase and Fis domain
MKNDKKADYNWIIPPGLLNAVKSFELFYKTLFDKASKIKNPPIIIFGPRGVGKTLFTMLFEQFYLRDNSTMTRDHIVKINVASIPQGLIESELFGHVRGAFTDAIKETNGFVTAAENGLLILEEIGELQHTLQSKLLTFVEDHYYYKVGSRKRLRAENIQIVATTNKKPTPEFFREDFLDRFYSFDVPPLHERRIDVLYYLYNNSPDVVARLKPHQVLALMAYNWPGNVREIEKIAHQMNVNVQAMGYPIVGFERLTFDKKSYPLVDGLKMTFLYHELKDLGVDVNFLEKELSRYRLGLSFQTKPTPAFPSSLEPSVSENESEKYNFPSYRIKPFDLAYSGFSQFFCRIFHLNPYGDGNLLYIAGQREPGPFTVSKKHKKLAKQISKVLEKIHKDFHASRTKDFPSLEQIIRAMTEDDFLRCFYNVLLKEEHGNKAAVARRAGIAPKTIYEKLKKLNID